MAPLESPISLGDTQEYPIGFYVHIPYCRRRCRYCSFAIVPVGGGANPAGNGRASPRTASFEKIHTAYQEDLFSELDTLLRTEQAKQTSSQSQIPLASVYFGGGTPSLAPLETIAGVLERLFGESSPFRLLDDAEITMEMDPGTFTTEDLVAWKDLGINRVSLGVQSFDDGILEALGRCHRSTDIRQAVRSIGNVFGGTANYSIDLISGVPGLSGAKWIETLEHATSFLDPLPCHLSVYDLQIEEGTVFSTWYSDEARGDDDISSDSGDFGNSKSSPLNKKRRLSRAIPSLPSEESVAEMYKFSAGYLRAKGFEHYEGANTTNIQLDGLFWVFGLILSVCFDLSPFSLSLSWTVSSYARIPSVNTSETAALSASKRSRHNQIYWEPLGSWYAIGLGATSMVQQRMISRPRTMAEYHDWVERWAHDDEDEEGSKVSEEDFLTDVIMKRLRTSDGLDLKWIEDRFGADTRQRIVDGASLGLELGLAELRGAPMSVTTSYKSDIANEETDTVLRLKDPDGFLYSNYLISSIFAELGYE